MPQAPMPEAPMPEARMPQAPMPEPPMPEAPSAEDLSELSPPTVNVLGLDAYTRINRPDADAGPSGE